MTTLRDQLSRAWVFLAIPLLALAPIVWGQNPKLEPIDVEGQPLAANVTRLLQALDMFGSPLPKEQTAALQGAAKNRDAKKLQELLDPSLAAQEAAVIRSAQSGPWSGPATWIGGKLPLAGARVQIRQGHTVVYDIKAEQAIRSVHIAGTLRFDPDR